MHDCLAVPQGIPTLAQAEPGTHVVVHSVMIPYGLMGTRVFPAAGEGLRCTRVAGDRIEFERADGSQFSMDRATAQQVRVEQFIVNDEAEWCAR